MPLARAALERYPLIKPSTIAISVLQILVSGALYIGFLVIQCIKLLTEQRDIHAAPLNLFGFAVLFELLVIFSSTLCSLGMVMRNKVAIGARLFRRALKFRLIALLRYWSSIDAFSRKFGHVSLYSRAACGFIVYVVAPIALCYQVHAIAGTIAAPLNAWTLASVANIFLFLAGMIELVGTTRISPARMAEIILSDQDDSKHAGDYQKDIDAGLEKIGWSKGTIFGVYLADLIDGWLYRQALLMTILAPTSHRIEAPQKSFAIQALAYVPLAFLAAIMASLLCLSIYENQ